MHVYIHTYIHTYAYTNTRTYTHEYTYTRAYTLVARYHLFRVSYLRSSVPGMSVVTAFRKLSSRNSKWLLVGVVTATQLHCLARFTSDCFPRLWKNKLEKGTTNRTDIQRLSQSGSTLLKNRHSRNCQQRAYTVSRELVEMSGTHLTFY